MDAMIYEYVQLSYSLTEAAYLASVATATGPVARDLCANIGIGELTPEARLALAESEKHYWNMGSSYLDGENSRYFRFLVNGELEAPPTPSEASALLVEAVRKRRERELENKRRMADEEASAMAKRMALLAELEASPERMVQRGNRGGQWDVFPMHWNVPQGERWNAVCAAAEGIAASRNEAERLDKAHRIAECNAWLQANPSFVGLPNVTRAAQEGRDTRREVMKAARKAIDSALRNAALSIPGLHVGQTSYEDKVRDGIPSKEAYQALDVASAVAETLNGFGPGIAVKCGAIARHDIAPSGQSAEWRTGVEITFSHPWFDEFKPDGALLLSERPESDEDE
jgi:hypothetical protein